jgi:hypothetical protein
LIINKKDVYVQTSSGDQVLIEIAEHHGWVMITADGRRIDLDPDSIFDLIDALTMVTNEMTSYVED